MSLRRSAAAAFAYRLVAGAAFCQRESGKLLGECSVIELLNRAGWSIPGLAGATTKIARAKVRQEGVPDDVIIDVLQPTHPDDTLTLVRCVPKVPGRLEVVHQPVRVEEVWRYSRRGRIFAYKVTGGLNAGNGVALGSSEVLLFYDPDGSGRFTVQRNIAGEQTRLFLPPWVASPH